MASLTRKLITTGLFVISAAFPSFGQNSDGSNSTENNSYYYGKGGLSIASYNLEGINEFFGNSILGFEGGVGILNPNSGRFEIQLKTYNKKNKDEDLEMHGFSIGAYYDLLLNPSKDVYLYAGAGLGGKTLIVDQKLPLNKVEREKTSGLILGLRVGAEIKLVEKTNLYIELFYITGEGKFKGEPVDLDHSRLTIGFTSRLQ